MNSRSECGDSDEMLVRLLLSVDGLPLAKRQTADNRPFHVMLPSPCRLSVVNGNASSENLIILCSTLIPRWIWKSRDMPQDWPLFSHQPDCVLPRAKVGDPGHQLHFPRAPESHAVPRLPARLGQPPRGTRAVAKSAMTTAAVRQRFPQVSEAKERDWVLIVAMVISKE